MKIAALLTVLLGSGCASTQWERTERVSSNGLEGRLYIPRLYAPLRPGSIYPDRRTPVPARGRPAIVVVCPETGDCRKAEVLDRAAQRGLVVLVLTRPPSAPLNLDLLRTRSEASAGHVGWLFVRPTEDFLRRWMEEGAAGVAGAILAPHRAHAPALPSSPSKQVFPSLSSSSPKQILLSLLDTDEAMSVPEGVLLKLYAARPSGGLPPEAFRDAIEWLAAALEAR